jgi:hypothetical protein
MLLSWLILLTLLVITSALIWRVAHRWALDRWLVPYILETRKRSEPKHNDPVHLILCIADHFEPRYENVTLDVAMERVHKWARRYPTLFSGFKDCDGVPPQHTFFYPLEIYDAAEMEAIADLCRAGFGEVEVHLHHDADNAANLRQRLLEHKEKLVSRHGLLGRHCVTGEVKYGFVHGDWALNNSRPDGRCCGVENELDVLRETGCYADFTLPSAPSPTQVRKINSIYYASTKATWSRSHQTGVDVGTGLAPEDGLMLIQGPLLLNWRMRRWGLAPRTENGNLQRSQPPTMDRLNLWLKARIQIPQRRDWFFVKLHAHGAAEMDNGGPLLGEPMVRFHQALADRAERNSNFHFHYVTAREMYNVVRAAAAGFGGSVLEARDFEVLRADKNVRALSSLTAVATQI